MKKKNRKYYLDRKIELMFQNVKLAKEIRDLLDELSAECQNKKLKTFIDILNWHIYNHKNFEKCIFCEERNNVKR